MSTAVSKQEIGKRIALLRKRKGLSQLDLANRIKISRSSLAQVELGNRDLSVLELQKLAMVLEFSTDEFLSAEFPLNPSIYMVAEPASSGINLRQERKPVIRLDIEKLRHLLLYLLERCAGKPNVGETVLNKLLYFAHFNYYEFYEEHLTGMVFRKLPHGPVPVHLDKLLSRMVDQGDIQRIQVRYAGLHQTRFVPLAKPDLKVMMASEKDVIDKVIDQFSDWSATAISHYSHRDMPWMATKEGDAIDYELAFYRESPYSVRMYDETEEPS